MKNKEIFAFTDGLDASYVDRKRGPVLEAVLSSYDDIKKEFHGSAEFPLTSLPSMSPLLFVSTHQSHLDYGLVSLLISDPNIAGKYPRIMAGTNLLGKKFSMFVRMFTGTDFRKMGAIPIERDRKGARQGKQTVTQLLTELKPVAIFPELWKYEKKGTEVTTVSKVGRSYDGTRAEFSRFLFSGITDAVDQLGTTGYVVPITISYDFVSEDRLFPTLLEKLLGREDGSKSTGLKGDWTYKLKELGFFLSPYRLGMGNVYFDIGQPIEVQTNTPAEDLADLATTSCRKMHRITSTSILSRCILGLTHDPTYRRLNISYNLAAEALQGKGHLFGNNVFGDENFDRAYRNMKERKLIHTDTRTYNLSHNTAVLKYYSNMLNHINAKTN